MQNISFRFFSSYPSPGSILIKIKTFKTSLTSERMCGSWILIEFPALRENSFLLRLLVPRIFYEGENSFLFGKSSFICVDWKWREKEKLFIIQQQEKLWAIKKDWIWLKSLLRLSVCLVEGKSFSISENPRKFHKSAKGKFAGIYLFR